MPIVFTIALPVFAVIAAGALAGRYKLVPAADTAALNRFVFRFAMPTALFGLTARAAPPGADEAAIALSYALAALLVMVIGYYSARRFFGLAPQASGAHSLNCCFGNAVFIGLPIALSVPGWASHYITLMLVEGTVIIGLGAVILSPADSPGATFRATMTQFLVRPLKNPLVVGMLAGISFSIGAALLGVSMPAPIGRFLDILGRAAGPTALFSVGLFIATTPKPSFDEIGWRVTHIAVMKLFVMPVLMLGVLAALGVSEPTILGPAALFGAVPTAVGAFVMTSAYGVYVRETTAAITVTSILSLLTVSGALLVYAQ